MENHFRCSRPSMLAAYQCPSGPTLVHDTRALGGALTGGSPLDKVLWQGL
jgi:hypothetical protein